MQINHDPDEPPPDRSKSPWLAAWIVVGLGWVGTFYSFGVDWQSVGLGALTAGIFVAHVLEITGNRVPASWRGKTPRS